MPPGQERAERHVGHHLAADRLAQQVLEPFHRLVLVRMNVQTPVPAARRRLAASSLDRRVVPAGMPCGQRAGAQLVDIGVDRPRAGHVAVAHEERERSAIDRRREHARVRLQRLELGAEQQQTARFGRSRAASRRCGRGPASASAPACPTGRRRTCRRSAAAPR